MSDLSFGGSLLNVNQNDVIDRFIGKGGSPVDASGRDFLDQLKFFFGQPAYPEKLVEEDVQHTHLQLPYAYIGKSVLLRDRLLGIVINTMPWCLQAPDGFPLEHAPFATYTWKQFSFDEGLMDILPEETPGYVLQSSGKTRSGSLLRKGKAIILEHGFFNTPEGRQFYYRQLQQLANTVNLTLAYDFITTLLNARPDTVAESQRMGNFNKPFRDIVAMAYRDVGIFQKEAFGINEVTTAVKNLMNARPGLPPVDCIITSENSTDYFFRGVGAEKLDYEKAGPSGPALRDVVPSSIRMFKDMRIRLVRSFLMDRRGQIPLDLLIKRMVAGEYYKMFAAPMETLHPVNSNLIWEAYTSEQRDILIFDSQQDDWSRITLRQFVEHLNIFDDDGNIEITDADLKRANNNTYENFKLKDPTARDLFLCFDPNLGSFRAVQTFNEIHPEFLPMKARRYMAEQIRLKGGIAALGYEVAEGDEEDEENEFRGEAEAEAAGAGNGARDPEYDIVGRSALKFTALPDELLTKAGVQTSLSGSKRQKAGARVGVYGQFSYTEKVPTRVSGKEKTGGPTAAVPLEQVDAHNLQLLKEQNHPESVIANYEAFKKTDGANIEGFIRRSNEVLSSGKPHEVSDNFVSPLASVLDGKSKSRTQHLNNIGALTTPRISQTPSEAQVVFAERTRSLPAALYTLSDVEKVAGQGTVNFTYLSPESRQPCNLSEALIHEAQLPVSSTKTSGKTSMKSMKRYKTGNSEGVSVVADNEFPELNIPVNKDSFLALIDNDIIFPFNGLVLRPMITLITQSVIFGAHLSTAGRTLYRNPDMMLGDDDANKTHRAFFTMDVYTVCENPLQVHVKDNVIIREIFAGYTAKAWTPEQISQLSQNNFVPPNDPNRPSWFPYILPMTNNRIHEIIDVTGRFFVENALDREDRHFMTTVADKTMQLYEARHAENAHPFHWEEVKYNRYCAQGTQKGWSRKDKSHTAMILGKKAPLGVNLYAGCAEHLKSRCMALDNMEYEKGETLLVA